LSTSHPDRGMKMIERIMFGVVGVMDTAIYDFAYFLEAMLKSWGVG